MKPAAPTPREPPRPIEVTCTETRDPQRRRLLDELIVRTLAGEFRVPTPVPASAAD
jgi:hypothetical protein